MSSQIGLQIQITKFALVASDGGVTLRVASRLLLGTRRGSRFSQGVSSRFLQWRSEDVFDTPTQLGKCVRHLMCVLMVEDRENGLSVQDQTRVIQQLVVRNKIVVFRYLPCENSTLRRARSLGTETPSQSCRGVCQPIPCSSSYNSQADVGSCCISADI